MYFYPLYSGSSGNCSLVKTEKTTILVDAGVSGKATLYALSACGVDPYSIDAILITHEHSDHIKGAGLLSRKFNIPVYANELTWGQMLPKLSNISRENIRVFETEHDFCINEVNVTPFSIPHDTVDPVAFSFEKNGRRLSVATDIGHITTRIFSELEKSNLILIEANHDEDMVRTGRYPPSLQRRILGDKGHLSNTSCAGLLVQLYQKGVRRAILGHLSRENNTEEIAFRTVSSILAQNGIGDNYMLKVAHFDRISGKFEV